MTQEATTSRAKQAPTPAFDRTVERIADLDARRALAVAPGGPRRRGEFGARERIERLLDPGSLTETGLFVRARTADDDTRRPYGDGVVTGHGTVDGRPVCVFAQDSTAPHSAPGPVPPRSAPAVHNGRPWGSRRLPR